MAIRSIFCFLLTDIKVNTEIDVPNLPEKIIFARFMKFLSWVLMGVFVFASCTSKYGKVLKSKAEMQGLAVHSPAPVLCRNCRREENKT